MTVPLLEGLLVDLVPAGKGFEDRVHTWENNESAFWGSAGDYGILTRAQIERHQAEQRSQPQTGVHFCIQTKDGTPIGSIGLGFLIPHHRLAMIGASIGEPTYWGGGYGTDALLLIVDYAFDWLDLRKLWLSTMSINVRVLRQMEKIGLVPEARQRGWWLADGQWCDDVAFGILRDEWPGRAALIERIGLRAAPPTP